MADREPRTALSEVEDALLWCMRAWVIGFVRKTDVSERIARVLAALGVADARGNFEGFMWALSHGARRTIGVDCVCHPETSADERRLLEVLAHQQAGGHTDAFAALLPLVTERAAALACDSAWRLGLALSAAGRPLRAPPLTVAPRTLH